MLYQTTEAYQKEIVSNRRTLRLKLIAGIETYEDGEELKSLSIESGAGGTEKVIGNAVSAKLTAEIGNVSALPVDSSTMRAYIWPDALSEDDAVPTAEFILENIEADEDNACYTLTGYDAMILLAAHTAAEIEIEYPTTIGAYAAAAAATAGLSLADTSWLNADVELTSAPNLDGSETCRDVIAWAAECAFGNAYIDRNGDVKITTIIPATEPNDINPDLYFECELGSVYGPINTLTLARSTEDNIYREDVEAVEANGRIDLQITDNPFLDAIRDDVIDTLFAQISGITIQPYTLDWRGDPAFDPGDTITLTDTKDNVCVAIYGAESLEFDGGMRSSVEFKSPSNATVDYSKATSAKEALRRTSLAVDKVNQKIEFEASRMDGVEGNVSAIAMTTDQISQSVTSIQEDTEGLRTRVAAIENDADSISLKVQDILDNGVDKVVTETGATLDADGLHVTKSGEQMESRIDYSGLHVERDGEAVLEATSDGVEAENVTVRTYLIIGKNSRFEDYGDDRTGCFYIGGSS